MRYIDVCSGISAPTMAWKPLGWEALCFAEIEAAPRSVLAHHYPTVPLRGDFTEIRGDEYGPVDLLVGGTPCQDFSVAGLRAGLDGERGNLSLEFLRLADRARPRWLVWENVPGVLSIDGGRAFGAILGGLAELGYGFAYRVLDAQHFGVPQRRRRVFVVGYPGDWRRAAAVLFERHSLSGHPAPRRQAGQATAGTLKACAGKSGTPNGAEEADRLIVSADPSHCLNAGGMGRQDYETETLIAHSLRAQSQLSHQEDRDTLVVADTLTSNGDAHSGYRDERGLVPVAFNHLMGAKAGGIGLAEEQAQTIGTRSGGGAAMLGSAVRRLTPRECERLQGFPDDFTLVPHRGKPMADGPRYKMLGNSMAVPVVRWIGERIQAVENIARAERLAA